MQNYLYKTVPNFVLGFKEQKVTNFILLMSTLTDLDYNRKFEGVFFCVD
jgi:hypothetical protein